jgi:hypothetical protein
VTGGCRNAIISITHDGLRLDQMALPLALSHSLGEQLPLSTSLDSGIKLFGEDMGNLRRSFKGLVATGHATGYLCALASISILGKQQLISSPFFYISTALIVIGYLGFRILSRSQLTPASQHNS